MTEFNIQKFESLIFINMDFFFFFSTVCCTKQTLPSLPCGSYIGAGGEETENKVKDKEC